MKLQKHLIRQELTGSKEFGNVPFKEHLKPVSQNEQYRPKYAPIRKIRLKTAVIGITVRINALFIQSRICRLRRVVKQMKRGCVEGYAQKRAYVKLIANHPKNPPTVVRLTNQLERYMYLSTRRVEIRKILLEDLLEDSRRPVGDGHER